MASCTTRQFSAISEHSLVTGTPSAIEAWLTSLPPASRANRSALPENAPERMTRATCGPQPSSASAWYDRASHSWRTFQVSFLAATLEPFSETWPNAGMMRNGKCYPQPSLALPTYENESGLWPTPRAFMHKDSCVDRGKGNLGEVVGGPLNPPWVEWLMGWPLGWTDLKPLEMDKFRQWFEQHGCYLEVNDE